MNLVLTSIGGVVLTGIGGEWFLRGGLDAARWLRISPGITATTRVAVRVEKMEGVNDHG
jgi:hypothetical protein